MRIPKKEFSDAMNALIPADYRHRASLMEKYTQMYWAAQADQDEMERLLQRESQLLYLMKRKMSERTDDPTATAKDVLTKQDWQDIADALH